MLGFCKSNCGLLACKHKIKFLFQTVDISMPKCHNREHNNN